MSDGCVSMFCFMFAKWLVLWIGPWQMCICLWPGFNCPEVTLCGWQDIKIQLLTYLRALRIVSPKKSLCCINTLIVINIILVMCNLAIDFVFCFCFFSNFQAAPIGYRPFKVHQWDEACLEYSLLLQWNLRWRKSTLVMCVQSLF